MTTALPPHDRQHRAGQGQGAEEVDIEQGTHRIFLAFFDSCYIAVAGIVDQRINAAKPDKRGVDTGCNVVRRPDIELQRNGLLGKALADVRDRGRIARSHRDQRAFLQSSKRYFAAKTRGAP